MCYLRLNRKHTLTSLYSQRRINETFQSRCLNVSYCVSLQGTNTFYMTLKKGHLFHTLSNGTLDHFLFSGLSFTPGNSTLNLNGSTQKPQAETLK